MDKVFVAIGGTDDDPLASCGLTEQEAKDAFADEHMLSANVVVSVPKIYCTRVIPLIEAK